LAYAEQGEKKPNETKANEPPKLNPKAIVSRFKTGLESTRKQRERERAALRFMVPEFQWDEAAKAARNGTQQGNNAIPARPTLSVSKIKQPVQLVQNAFQNANLDINSKRSVSAISFKASSFKSD